MIKYTEITEKQGRHCMNDKKFHFDDMTGEEFENFLKTIFERLGYEVETTPISGDFGADLILTKNNERIVVQAKRYSSTVGISAIQEIFAAKKYYSASSAMVVTNNYFTSAAIELAVSTKITLWDREKLIEEIVNMQANKDNAETIQIPLNIEEVITSNEYKCINNNLSHSIIIGAYRNSIYINTIENMNNIIIYGHSGSGKTMLLYCFLVSLLELEEFEYSYQMILIDTKSIDFHEFNGIPPLIIPVIEDEKKVIGALNWVIAEMQDRYEKLKHYQVKTINEYNKIKTENEPEIQKISVFVDELSEIYQYSGYELSDAIEQITLKGTRVGIHLIMATQNIKIYNMLHNNFYTKILFTAPHRPNILQKNLEVKIGNHIDNIFTLALSYENVKNIIAKHVKKNHCDLTNLEIEEKIKNTRQAVNDMDSGVSERDAYFKDAGKFIIEVDKASIGMLQRKFRIGFNRTAKIMDQLADAGVVGEEEGTRPRKVLMTMEEFEAYIDKNDSDNPYIYNEKNIENESIIPAETTKNIDSINKESVNNDNPDKSVLADNREQENISFSTKTFKYLSSIFSIFIIIIGIASLKTSKLFGIGLIVLGLIIWKYKTELH